MQKTCIVIPCFNEEHRFNIQMFISDFENNRHYYLFVNDGSTDNTINVLSDFIKGRTDRSLILDLKENVGKAEAVRQGIIAALKWDNFEIIGFLDADLATPLNELGGILKEFDNKIFFVFGSRIKKIGSKIQRKTTRHILGRIFATITSFILHEDIYDSQCGCKFMKSEIAREVFKTKFVTNWIFDLEIFFRIKNILLENELSIYAKEHPISQWSDIGDSRIKLIDFILIPHEIIKLIKYYR